MHKIASNGSKDGRFVDTEGDKDGTVLTAEWLNTVQDELVAVATMDGATLLETQNDQVSSAIRTRINLVEESLRHLILATQAKADANKIRLNNRVGEIVTTLSSFGPPDCLPCNGAEYVKSDYPKLIEYVNRYELWSTVDVDTVNGKWGKFVHSNTGSTLTHFYVPNLTGLFLRMAGDGAGALGIYQGDEIKEHRHLTYWGDTANILNNSSIPNDGSRNSLGSKRNDYDNARPYTSYVGGDETRPRNVAVNFWVRYQ